MAKSKKKCTHVQSVYPNPAIGEMGKLIALYERARIAEELMCSEATLKSRARTAPRDDF